MRKIFKFLCFTVLIFSLIQFVPQTTVWADAVLARDEITLGNANMPARNLTADTPIPAGTKRIYVHLYHDHGHKYHSIQARAQLLNSEGTCIYDIYKTLRGEPQAGYITEYEEYIDLDNFQNAATIRLYSYVADAGSDGVATSTGTATFIGKLANTVPISWSGSAEKTLTTNGSVHSGGYYGSVDEYITATNNIANFSTIQGTIYNSTTQASINSWYTANASASITVAIVNTRTGQTITSENITKSNNGHYQNNPLTSSTNASLSGTKDFMFDLNALREAGHKMSECELRVIFNISHAVDQANETTTMGVSDVLGVQSSPNFNSNLPSPQIGLEGNSYHVTTPATFPEGSQGNTVDWYLLVDDGLGHNTAETIKETYKEQDNIPTPNDDMVWVKLNEGLYDPSTKESIRSVYNVEIQTGNDTYDTKEVKNRFEFSDSATVAKDTMHIYNLSAGEKSLDGAIFKMVAKNQAAPEGTESAYFRFDVKLGENYYQTPSTSKIKWNYGLNGNGEIVSLWTEDEDLSSIIDSQGVLHIPAVIEDMVVKGIGSGNNTFPVVPASTGGKNINRTAFSSVEIPDTITIINDYAFSGVSGIPNNGTEVQPFDVIIPSSITTMGEKVFYSSGVRDVKVYTDNLNSYRGFADCPNLERVVFNANSSIARCCFQNCDALKNVEFNGNITLGERSFEGAGIEELCVPSRVVLGEQAFLNCTDLAKLQINTATVGNRAFDGCTGLSYVIFDSNVEKVEKDWAGTSIDGADMYVKNNKTAFYSSTSVSPFGNAGTTTIYYEAAYDDRGARIQSISMGEASGRLLKIQESYEAADENKEVFTASNSVALSFQNYGYRTGESKDEFDAVKDARDSALKNMLGGIGGTNGLGLLDLENDNPGAQDGITGIYAEYGAKLFVGELLDKADVTVKQVGGLGSGSTINALNFYVMRDLDYQDIESYANTLIGAEGDIAAKVKEKLNSAEFKSATKIRARESDIANGDKAGTILAYAIYLNNASENGMFSAPFNITVEERTPAAYAYREYGTYSEIINAVGNIMQQIDALQEEVNNYSSLLDYIEQLLGDNANASIGDLMDKRDEAQAEYDELLAEDPNFPNTEEGRMLRKTIDALEALINKGMSIKNLKDDLAAKRQELARLQAEAAAINASLAEFEDSLLAYNGLGTYVHKKADGSDDEYFIFINGIKFKYYPSEDDPTFVPDDENLLGRDLQSHTLHTAHVDTTLDPAAYDMDGKAPDDQFKFYAIGSKVYIIGTRDYYDKSTNEYISEAKTMIDDMNTAMLALQTALDNCQNDLIAAKNAIAAAGYDVSAADDAPQEDLLSAVKDAVVGLIQDYNRIRDEITGETGSQKHAEDVLNDLNNLYKKVTDMQELLKEKLAGTNGSVDPNDDRDLTTLLNAVQALKDELDAVKDPEYANKLKSAEDKATDLQRRLDEALANANNGGGASEEEIKGYKDQIADLTAQLEDLKKNGASQETINALQSKIDSLNERIQSLLETNAELKGNNKVLESRNSTLEKELSTTKSSLAGKDSQILALSTENATLKATPSSSYPVQTGGGTRTVTTPSGNGGTTTNNTEKTTNITQKECEHEWEYKDNGDGTHTKTCKKCGEKITENHKYDELTKKCECGALQKDEKAAIKPLVDQSTCEHEWKYVDNKNGTHTATCEKCHLVKTQKHEFDENGKCVCGAEDESKKEDEEETKDESKSVPWIRKTADTSTETTTTTGTDGAALGEEEEEEGGVSIWLILGAILAVGAAAFAVYWFVLKDKIGNKQTAGDDDDDELEDDEEFISSDAEELEGMDNPDEDDLFAGSEDGETEGFNTDEDDDPIIGDDE